MADSDGDDSVDDELLQALGSSDDEDDDGSGAEQEDDGIVFTSSNSGSTSARESAAGSAAAANASFAGQEDGSNQSTTQAFIDAAAKYKAARAVAEAKQTDSFTETPNSLTPKTAGTMRANSLFRKEAPPEASTKPLSDHNKVDTCKFSGLRIRDRVVEEGTVQEICTGRRVVKLSQLTSLPESVCGDIVVMGVLSNKTATKLGAKGERYSMWFINNLNGSEMTLFLFGEAHEGHWKQHEGVVVAILNPKKSDKEENNKEHKNAAYNVSNSGQLLVIGRSKDYGKCKSLRKDGQPCTKVVNLSTCPYCEHHMAGEYKKISSKRANLNDSTGLPGGVMTVAMKAQMANNRKAAGSTKTKTSLAQHAQPQNAPRPASLQALTGNTSALKVGPGTKSLKESLSSKTFEKLSANVRPGAPGVGLQQMKAGQRLKEEAEKQGKSLKNVKLSGPAPQSVPRKTGETPKRGKDAVSRTPTTTKKKTTVLDNSDDSSSGEDELDITDAGAGASASAAAAAAAGGGGAGSNDAPARQGAMDDAPIRQEKEVEGGQGQEQGGDDGGWEYDDYMGNDGGDDDEDVGEEVLREMEAAGESQKDIGRSEAGEEAGQDNVHDAPLADAPLVEGKGASSLEKDKGDDSDGTSTDGVGGAAGSGSVDGGVVSQPGAVGGPGRENAPSAASTGGGGDDDAVDMSPSGEMDSESGVKTDAKTSAATNSTATGQGVSSNTGSSSSGHGGSNSSSKGKSLHEVPKGNTLPEVPKKSVPATSSAQQSSTSSRVISAASLKKTLSEDKGANGASGKVSGEQGARGALGQTERGSKPASSQASQGTSSSKEVSRSGGPEAQTMKGGPSIGGSQTKVGGKGGEKEEGGRSVAKEVDARKTTAANAGADGKKKSTAVPKDKGQHAVAGSKSTVSEVHPKIQEAAKKFRRILRLLPQNALPGEDLEEIRRKLADKPASLPRRMFAVCSKILETLVIKDVDLKGKAEELRDRCSSKSTAIDAVSDFQSHLDPWALIGSVVSERNTLQSRLNEARKGKKEVVPGQGAGQKRAGESGVENASKKAKQQTPLRMPGEGEARKDKDKEKRPASSSSSDRTGANAASSSSSSGASKGGLSEEEMRKRKAAAEAAAKQGGIAPLRPNSVGDTSLTKESAEVKRKEAADRERFKEEARKRKEEKGGAADADDGGMELGYVNDLNRAKKPRTDTYESAAKISQLASLFPMFKDQMETKEGREEIINAKSQHEDLADLAIDEAMDRQKNAILAKGAIEEKMLNTTEVEVKVYKCETCDGGWTTYPPKCAKDLGHNYQTKQGKKYWFECKKCKKRDTCTETLGPRFDCHCGARDWKKTTQGYSKEVAPGSDFKARGEEHGQVHVMTLTQYSS